MAEKLFKFKQADFIIALALMIILGVLIMPVPTPLLDIFLVLSIGMGMLVLILTTQLSDPLQLSSFPSLLLIMTLFRLSLNVATTRQILLRGFAGNVIQSFGDFVVGGNYVVGIVVFLILVIINFMVITKGSGRIAEVAARFTLDAMPGKQMSVDADLNSGLIDEKEALSRREKLRQESDFYGAMDGASKFVRGDAVAGLIITVINICGGFAVGMLQQNMSAGDALRTYTILTVGDGLVSQIPALVISTAAGMLVTRAASDDTVGVDVAKQLFLKPKPLLITGSLLSIVSLVPGLPFLPFIALGGTLGGVGIALKSSGQEAKEEGGNAGGGGAPLEGKQAPGLPPASNRQIPAVSPMDLEIGFGLVPLVDRKQGGKLIDRIGLVRGQLVDELGFMLPPVNVRDNMQLRNTEYCIKVRGLEVARDSIRVGMLLAVNPGSEEKLDGFVLVREPAFGFDAYWIPKDKKDFAEAKGMTVVDAASVITTHLAEAAKRNASQILSRQDVSDMIDQLKETHPSVVQEMMPAKLTIGMVHRVLQELLNERVSIRDLVLILETVTDHAARIQEPEMLAEYARRALGGHICKDYLDPDGSLLAIGLHPDLDNFLKQAIHQREGSDLGALVLDPEVVGELMDEIGRTVESTKKREPQFAFLCSPSVRPHFRKLSEHNFGDIPVLSYIEVPKVVNVEMLGMLQSAKVLETSLVESESLV